MGEEQLDIGAQPDRQTDGLVNRRKGGTLLGRTSERMYGWANWLAIILTDRCIKCGMDLKGDVGTCWRLKSCVDQAFQYPVMSLMYIFTRCKQWDKFNISSSFSDGYRNLLFTITDNVNNNKNIECDVSMNVCVHCFITATSLSNVSKILIVKNINNNFTFFFANMYISLWLWWWW